MKNITKLNYIWKHKTHRLSHRHKWRNIQVCESLTWYFWNHLKVLAYMNTVGGSCMSWFWIKTNREKISNKTLVNPTALFNVYKPSLSWLFPVTDSGSGFVTGMQHKNRVPGKKKKRWKWCTMITFRWRNLERHSLKCYQNQKRSNLTIFLTENPLAITTYVPKFS